jgi:hypothetical protein
MNVTLDHWEIITGEERRKHWNRLTVGRKDTKSRKNVKSDFLPHVSAI